MNIQDVPLSCRIQTPARRNRASESVIEPIRRIEPPRPLDEQGRCQRIAAAAVSKRYGIGQKSDENCQPVLFPPTGAKPRSFAIVRKAAADGGALVVNGAQPILIEEDAVPSVLLVKGECPTPRLVRLNDSRLQQATGNVLQRAIDLMGFDVAHMKKIFWVHRYRQRATASPTPLAHRRFVFHPGL